MKQGWEIKKLGDVCEIFAGGDVPKDAFSKKRSSVFNIPIFSNGENNKGLYGYTNKARVKESSVTISARGTIGYSEIRNEPFYPAIRLIVATPKETWITLSFLDYVIKGIDFIHSGTSIPQLTVPMVKEYAILLPPLLEQKNIVSILEKVFTSIDNAKANAEQNLRNVKELFESFVQSIFSNLNWPEKRISDVCTEIFAGGDAPKKDFSLIKTEQCKIPIYANAVSNQGLYGYTNYARVTNPSITIAARGSGTGHTEIRYEPYLPIVRLIVLVPNKESIRLEFLKYAIDNLTIVKSGSAIPQLTVPMIKDYKIPLPSLKEQNDIVKQLNKLCVQTQKLEAIYQKKLDDLEELKKSILQKAFAGELSDDVSIQLSNEPLERIAGISTTDLQAGITVLALQKHMEAGKENTFHHVKAEKIIHLAEYVLNIDLERNPVKDAAGPNDFIKVKQKVEPRAAKAGFYTVKKTATFYEYRLGGKANQVATKAHSCLADKTEKLNWLLTLMAPLNTEQAEVIATVYAAWNNLLIDQADINDEAIVAEARENWHQNKMNIERDKFFKAIAWMRNKNLVPTGNGKKVAAKTNV